MSEIRRHPSFLTIPEVAAQKEEALAIAAMAAATVEEKAAVEARATAATLKRTQIEAVAAQGVDPEVKESQVYSDHLPVLLEAPLTADKKIKIVSLNMLGVSAGSGLHADSEWETDAEGVQRYRRIVDGLINAQQKHQANIFLLQEVGDVAADVLREKLGETWEVVVSPRSGVISCFNKDHFQQAGSEAVEIDRFNKIQSLHLQDKATGAVFDVHNVWGNYNYFPDSLEQLFRRYLQKNPNRISIFAGDTNSRIAPLDDTPRNITTGIVPVAFNKDNGAVLANGEGDRSFQISDHPDGGFYRDLSGKIHQIKHEILSFSTGDIVRDERTKEQIDPWPEYRMVLCLDESFDRREVINNQTIFAYEQALINVTGDADIRVRMAATSFNEKAIGIKFSRQSALYQTLASDPELSSEHGFQRKTIDDSSNTRMYHCLFVPLDKVKLLNQKISARYIFPEVDVRGKALTELSARKNAVSTFQLFKPFLQPSPSKEEALGRLVERIGALPPSATRAEIHDVITSWESAKEWRLYGTNETEGKISNRDIIADHRNMFFSQDRSVTNATLDLLAELKALYRSPASP